MPRHQRTLLQSASTTIQGIMRGRRLPPPNALSNAIVRWRRHESTPHEPAWEELNRDHMAFDQKHMTSEYTYTSGYHAITNVDGEIYKDEYDSELDSVTDAESGRYLDEYMSGHYLEIDGEDEKSEDEYFSAREDASDEETESNNGK